MKGGELGGGVGGGDGGGVEEEGDEGGFARATGPDDLRSVRVSKLAEGVLTMTLNVGAALARRARELDPARVRVAPGPLYEDGGGATPDPNRPASLPGLGVNNPAIVVVPSLNGLWKGIGPRTPWKEVLVGRGFVCPCALASSCSVSA